MQEFTHSKDKKYISGRTNNSPTVIDAPVGTPVSTYGEITVNAPNGSWVKAESGSTVLAQTGAVIEAYHGSKIIVHGRCLIMHVGGAIIEYHEEALVIANNTLSKSPYQIRKVTCDKTFGDNQALIVESGVHVKTGKNCYVLAFDNTIVETGDDCRVLSGNGCAIRTGSNSFVRTGNRSFIYTGKKTRINCGDFCTLQYPGECRIIAGKSLRTRFTNSLTHQPDFPIGTTCPAACEREFPNDKTLSTHPQTVPSMAKTNQEASL